jgi:hypothetical protein
MMATEIAALNKAGKTATPRKTGFTRFFLGCGISMGADVSGIR